MEKVKVGLMGLGTVGGGVWDVLRMNRDEIIRNCGYEIKIEKILVKEGFKPKVSGVSKDKLTHNFDDIVENDEIEIVIELIGGIEPAREYILRAIKAGKHVVTANKALLAQHGVELSKAAYEAGVRLSYEASVAGGVPIINPLKESLGANKIKKIMGILNGTTNYILTKMTNENVDFHTVLKEAQDMGYAEADPTADVEGFDAAHKLTILSTLAFGTPVKFKDVHREGITKINPLDIEYARELGYVIKLLGIAKEIDGELELRVHPTFIPKNHPLAAVNDSFNAVFVKGNAVGDLMFYGRGAGDLPTASAVISDVMDIIKKRSLKPNLKNGFSYEPTKKAKPMGEIVNEYYIRFMVKDIPGVLGKIATLFGEYNVSLSSVIQKGRSERGVPLVFITHEARESDIQKALQEVNSIDEVIEIGNIIRVENGQERGEQ